MTGSGETQITSSGTMTLEDEETLDTRTLDNLGTVNWQADTTNQNVLTMQNGAVWKNESGSTFDARLLPSGVFTDEILFSGTGSTPAFNNLAGATFTSDIGIGFMSGNIFSFVGVPRIMRARSTSFRGPYPCRPVEWSLAA